MNQTNSGVATQNQYGVSTNTPFTGTQIPSMMASTNPVANVPSPAVISNQSAKDKVTEMTNTVNTLAQGRGMTSDGTTTKYADGTIATDNYQDPVLPQGTSPVYGSVLVISVTLSLALWLEITAGEGTFATGLVDAIIDGICVPVNGVFVETPYWFCVATPEFVWFIL